MYALQQWVLKDIHNCNPVLHLAIHILYYLQEAQLERALQALDLLEALFAWLLQYALHPPAPDAGMTTAVAKTPAAASIASPDLYPGSQELGSTESSTLLSGGSEASVVRSSAEGAQEGQHQKRWVPTWHGPSDLRARRGNKPTYLGTLTV